MQFNRSFLPLTSRNGSQYSSCGDRSFPHLDSQRYLEDLLGRATQLTLPTITKTRRKKHGRTQGEYGMEWLGPHKHHLLVVVSAWRALTIFKPHFRVPLAALPSGRQRLRGDFIILFYKNLLKGKVHCIRHALFPLFSASRAAWIPLYP